MKNKFKSLAVVFALMFMFSSNKIFVQQAIAAGDICIQSQNTCTVTWWKCVGGDCWRETMTVSDMEPYGGAEQ